MAVYAYCRPSVAPAAADFKTQVEAVQGDCASKDLPPAGLFSDKSETGNLKLADRHAGRQLSIRLCRGDHVVFARLASSFRNGRDAASTFSWWRARGVIVHFVELGLQVDPAGPESERFYAIVNWLVTSDCQRLSEAARRARARSRAEGRKLNGTSPYGFRWAGRGRAPRLVADRGEQRTMAAIAGWRAQGYGWESIWRRLLEDKVKTKDGKEWTLARIWRACRRYHEYQARALQRMGLAQ